MSPLETKRRDFWANILRGVVILVAVIGLALCVPPQPAALYFNFIFFGSPEYPSSLSPESLSYVKFLYGLTGALTVGWMVPLYYLSDGPIRRGDQAAWNAAALSVGLWFITDSGISLYHGFWQNAVSNCSLLALFVIPMWMLRKS